MGNRQRPTFMTVTSEGALLPLDILQRIAQFDATDTTIKGLTTEDYHCAGEKLNEAINNSWLHLLRAWQTFQNARAQMPEHDTGTTITRERWLLPLFSELGYGRLFGTKPIEVEAKSYPISHGWQHTPIHLVSYKLGLDHLSRHATTTGGGYRFSPYSMIQELLNRSSEHLWGFVSNGLLLRVLRKNVSLTRQAYVEFDLEAMLKGEVYSDFVLLWLLCHQSRVESVQPSDCWLEKWSRLAREEGTRVLEKLREGVEQAINLLGSDFLEQSANQTLREKLRRGVLTKQDYYRQILRLVYRLIILFVAEDRDVLLHPDADEKTRTRYTDYYSTVRLRRLAEHRIGTRHIDLFQSLRLVMEQLGNPEGCPGLGLPALNGFLFSRHALPDLADCTLTNHALLDAIRSLAFTYNKQSRVRRAVDYKNIGSEELGSVYEALLELHPEMQIESATFKLQTASGNERKTSGTYYTPTSLIDCLLDSALEPVLIEACQQPTPEKAILNLKVCDPACGSGHFLIAAAHRIARRLAAVRTGSEEPSAEARRTALRDVVGRCIYGVDINPMAVELCKVNLWMEAIEPGKPFSFLDAHIQCGNSLLGATPTLLKDGIPDSAFEAIEGDDKKICSEYKKKNKVLRTGQLSLFTEDLQPWDRLGDLVTGILQLEEIGDSTVEELHRKQERYAQLVASSSYENGKLWADAWCAAFVWKKTNEFAYPITEEVFRRLEQNPYTLAGWMKDEIRRLAEQYQFFHWHIAFPDVFRVPPKGETPENEQTGWSGGFDVVLSNPPWERIKIQEKEWFASRRPDIANVTGAVQRRRMISELQYKDSSLYSAFIDAQRKTQGESHFARNSQRYPWCGRGDVNMYTLFTECMWDLINSGGRLGCIIPSGIATDDTTKLFFKKLVDSKELVSLFDFRNEVKLFPNIDHQVKFTLLTLGGNASMIDQIDFAFGLYRTEELEIENRHFSLSAKDIALFNPNTYTCPTFRTKRDMELTKAIYTRLSVLIKEDISEENLWNISFSRMFDMTNDSHLFRTRKKLEKDGWILKGNIFVKEEEEEAYLPLYEGKMISLFDHRFGTYEGREQDERELEAAKHADPFSLSLPRYWVHSSFLPENVKKGKKASVVFRMVARSTDARTAIFSLLPALPCGNSLAIMMTDSENSRQLLWLTSCTSSIVFDYIVRQKLGGPNMNFFVVKQFPMVAPSDYTLPCKWNRQCSLDEWLSPRILELVYTAWDLEPFAKECGYNIPPFQWHDDRRFLLRCEIDAAYFHLYGMDQQDIDYVLETFPIVRERDEKQYDEYRTKRVILEIYDQMRQAIESGVAYETRLDPPPADAAVAHAPRAEVEV
jgi:hypothetical protein